MVLADGATKFVSDGIAWLTWQNLGTRNDGMTINEY